LPHGKHFHVVVGLANVLLRRLPPVERPLISSSAALSTPNLEKEEFGAKVVTQLSWKQGLDVNTCTECGRCQTHCPTAITGKPLTHKAVNQAIKHFLWDHEPEMSLVSKTEDGRFMWRVDGEELEMPPLVAAEGGVLKPETVWACTTCGWCETACPVFIENIPRLIDMRRYKVQVEADFPPELQRVFEGVERQGNPWGLGQDKRDEWEGELPLPKWGDGGEYEYLFYVGCAGSYDERMKKVSRAVAKVLTEAKVKFATLGKEETCNGELARRGGNEYLFQTIAKTNVEAWNSKGIKAIVTQCPHCYNTLKNEYPEFGGNYRVLSHTELITELIKTKRDGGSLDADDIRLFIEGYTDGDVTDYQMSAMCMAVFFRGLSPAELTAWTRAMLESGDVLDLSDTPGVKVDKHSTGGVGDKVSLSLAPLAAACGVVVPMVSGRGLGHTGGTLDKLESIPGFEVDMPVAEYRRLVKEVGACLIGQTSRLAPADKQLYALRDVTATVDCLPLIASSIMSKKLAEGIDALLLDVKVGSGAFMKSLEDARALAQTMIGIGKEMGKRVVAVITNMDEPLGRTVGNALEVVEAVEMLRGKAPADYTELTLALTAEMLVLGGKAPDVGAARPLLLEAIASGAAEAKLRELVTAQGGDVGAIEDLRRLPRASHTTPVLAERDGFVTRIDSEAIGLAAMTLGAGRGRTTDTIDPAVGFYLDRKVGEAVKASEPLVTVHHNGDARLEDVMRRVRAAYTVGDAPPTPRPLVVERLE